MINESITQGWAGGRLFKCKHIVELIEVTVSVKTKHALLEALIPRSVDPSAGGSDIVDGFRFSSDKEIISDALRNRVRALVCWLIPATFHRYFVILYLCGAVPLLLSAVIGASGGRSAGGVGRGVGPQVVAGGGAHRERDGRQRHRPALQETRVAGGQQRRREQPHGHEARRQGHGGQPSPANEAAERQGDLMLGRGVDFIIVGAERRGGREDRGKGVVLICPDEEKEWGTRREVVWI
jgi:hypothetical protein